MYLPDFLVRAGLAGMALAIAAGPYGSMLVWSRSAFFADVLAHASFLGVACAVLWHTPTMLTMLGVTFVAACGLMRLPRNVLGTDVSLAILAQLFLALGLLVFAAVGSNRSIVPAILFGDILALSWQDVAVMGAMAAGLLGALTLLWQPFLRMVLHEDLARVEGVPVGAVRFGCIVLLGVAISLAAQLIGVLLVGSLLVIPAATARFWTNTPRHMAVLSSVLGCVGVLGGLSLSWVKDVPAGPAVSVILGALFVSSLTKELGRGFTKRT